MEPSRFDLPVINRIALSLAASALLAVGASAQQDTTAARPAPVAGPPATVPAPAPSRRPRGSRNLITREEIQSRTEIDLFTLVYTIRPAWMRLRGQNYMDRTESIRVYVNNQLAGDPQVLKQIQPQNVESVRFLDSVEASSRLGAAHGVGAILVTLR